jgi:hypothetical protein
MTNTVDPYSRILSFVGRNHEETTDILIEASKDGLKVNAKKTKCIAVLLPDCRARRKGGKQVL